MPKIQCDIAVIGSDVIGLCCGYALKKLGYPSNLSLSVRVHAIGLHLGLAFILAKASLTGPQSYLSETGTQLPPLQLSTSQARLSLEPQERAHLAKCFGTQRHRDRMQNSAIISAAKVHAPSHTKHRTLEQPSNSKFARFFKSQRGGHFTWSFLDTARNNLDFKAYPSKALLALAGLSESSSLPVLHRG